MGLDRRDGFWKGLRVWLGEGTGAQPCGQRGAPGMATAVAAAAVHAARHNSLPLVLTLHACARHQPVCHAGLVFFTTYTLLVLFWAEIYHQARCVLACAPMHALPCRAEDSAAAAAAGGAKEKGDQTGGSKPDLQRQRPCKLAEHTAAWRSSSREEKELQGQHRGLRGCKGLSNMQGVLSTATLCCGCPTIHAGPCPRARCGRPLWGSTCWCTPCRCAL